MRQSMERIFARRPVWLGLLAVNLFGALYGFWWYRGQFAVTPLHLWPFVPNSPLAVTWFIVVLVLWLGGRRSTLLEGLAYFGLIKHGLWTVAIIWMYEWAGQSHAENLFLWTGHLGMALQAILFWYVLGLPLSRLQAGAIAGWYLFNDFLDYGVGIYPTVDTAVVSLPVVRSLALAYSIFLTGAVLYAAQQKRKEQPS
jgi:uncharacterized membrane protein YpjA